VISTSRKERAIPTPEREEHSLVSFWGQGITVKHPVRYERGRGPGGRCRLLAAGELEGPRRAALSTQTHPSWKPGPLPAARQCSQTESFRANSSRGPHPLLYPPSTTSCFLSLSPAYMHMTTEAGTVTSRGAVGHKPLKRGWVPRNA